MQEGESSKASGFSFSFNKKPATTGTKRKASSQVTFEAHHEGAAAVDYITSVQDGNLTSLHSEAKRGPLVIPMIENHSSRVNKKYIPLIMGMNKKPDESAVATEPENGTGAVTEKTFNSLDEMAAAELIGSTKGKEIVEIDPELELPLLLKHRNPDLDEITDEDQRFRADVESRPNESNLSNYEQMPIESFGKALLRGMGWKPGGLIGLTNPKFIEPIEYVQRAGYRTGLGATPQLQEQKVKKYIKPGESRDDNIPKVVAPDENGHTRHTKKISEELVPMNKVGICEGALVSIIAGPHDGLSGVILKIFLDENIAVRLNASQSEVMVAKSDLAVLNKNSLSKDHPMLSMDDDKKNGKEISNTQKKPEKKEEPKEKSWLYPHLLVRIVSKSVSGGKYYLKKAIIVDVLTPLECTVQMQENQKLVEVKQRMLETVIPKSSGERLMIVKGPNRGRIGKLNSKSKESAQIQLLDDFSVEEYNLDSICQYTGEDD